MLVLGSLLDLAALPLPAAPVDYLHEIKPLLTQHCVRCHGEQKEEGGLRVDTAASMHLGGASGSILRRPAGRESLLEQVLAGTHEDIPAMPYKKPRLAAEEIARIRAWVADGAPAPEREEPGRWEHWAFVPPRRPSPPPLPASLAGWPRNDLDRFIGARLAAAGISPSPEADRITLLRRISLDLTGLPPTPDEVSAFVADQAPAAFERLVDRLLTSPHYGERWARPWLDAARYADSNGYSIDAPRQIWKYRDWVVAAFNRDLPFNQFVIEQLAGDLLPQPTVEQRIATGFNRNTQINQEGGIDPEQFRIESVLDRVNTYGTVFLGLTLSCAQCHDHKFDPISQTEYYRLYAFFNNSVDDGHGDRRSRSTGVLHFDADGRPDDRLEAELAETREQLEALFEQQGTTVEAWRRALPPEQRRKHASASLRAALDVEWARQSFNQRRAVFPLARPEDPAFKALNDRYGTLTRREGKAVSTLVMEELPEPRPSVVFIKGDFTRPGAPVTPGTPAVLPPLRAEKPNRLDLARWTVDANHPLTARVLVNRVWQQYFGRGLVETENDFGSQGTPPSHPELLDWLASELIARGWSLKALHRLIVTSATYRQASRVRPDLETIDPLNRLLARQSRLRLDAEIVRDAALRASGLLVPTLGGPPVFPPQPDGVMSLGQVKREWKPSTGPDRHRRGLYTHFWRATPHPALAVFDAADGFSACTRRLRSNTPLQALTLLNDRQFVEFAEALARRIQSEVPDDLGARIDFAFRCCLARPPSEAEKSRVAELYQQQLTATAGEETARRQAAWLTVARVLLNLDETITRE
ncbi:MAG: PSD1 domain-containing protein [Verrucomicrobia bacterium]|nr:PSD1 domain-containing protein [Verrucomicrobiota bacterium]